MHTVKLTRRNDYRHFFPIYSFARFPGRKKNPRRGLPRLGSGFISAASSGYRFAFWAKFRFSNVVPDLSVTGKVAAFGDTVE